MKNNTTANFILSSHKPATTKACKNENIASSYARGLIIIDNVLWYGQVVEENSDDKITLTIKDFNNYVSKDKRVEKIIVPLGDGMTVCRKL